MSKCSIDSNFLGYLMMSELNNNQNSRKSRNSFVLLHFRQITILVLEVQPAVLWPCWCKSICTCLQSAIVKDSFDLYILYISGNQPFRSSRCIRPSIMIRVSHRIVTKTSCVLEQIELLLWLSLRGDYCMHFAHRP